METILVTANVVLAIVLVLIILLQRSEGGALGLGVSQDNFASTRAVGSFLTKSTGIIAALFIISSILLVVISRGDLQETQSVIEKIEEKKDFDEDYFKKLDSIENDILDGKTFDSIISRNKQKVINIEFVNSRKYNQDGVFLEKINDTFLKKIFSIENKNKPEFISFDNNYYVAEVLDEKDMVLTLKDQEFKKTIMAQLEILIAVIRQR